MTLLEERKQVIRLEKLRMDFYRITVVLYLVRATGGRTRIEARDIQMRETFCIITAADGNVWYSPYTEVFQ